MYVDFVAVQIKFLSFLAYIIRYILCNVDKDYIMLCLCIKNEITASCSHCSVQLTVLATLQLYSFLVHHKAY